MSRRYNRRKERRKTYSKNPKKKTENTIIQAKRKVKVARGTT